MKKTLLTIALATAALPMFAKQVPPPANTTTDTKPAVTSKKAKKHVKKAPKAKATPATAPAGAAVKPAK